MLVLVSVLGGVIGGVLLTRRLSAARSASLLFCSMSWLLKLIRSCNCDESLFKGGDTNSDDGDSVQATMTMLYYDEG